MANGHIMLLYSVGDIEKREGAGATCIVHRECVGQLKLKVQILTSIEQLFTFIIAYGLNENEKKEEKELFWADLQKLIDN